MVIEITRKGDDFTISVGGFSRKSKTKEVYCSDYDGPYYYNYARQKEIKNYFDEETSKLILNLKDGETIALASKNFVKIKNEEEYFNLSDSEEDEEDEEN